MSAPKCPISGYRFATFGCWYGVGVALDEGCSLFYHAPLDAVVRPLTVLKRFKNGKLRVRGGEVTFTIDSGHLERLFWLQPQQEAQ